MDLKTPGSIKVDLFRRTVSAMVHTLIVDRARDASQAHLPLSDDVVYFVLGQQARMPDLLRGPFRLATLFLNLNSLVTRGRLFPELSHGDRRCLIERWRCSRIGGLRDIVRFYESLSIFFCYGQQQDGVAPHGFD